VAMKLRHYPTIEGSYGGHQLWWGQGSVGQHYGCGVIAGVDSLIYRGVLGHGPLNKAEYGRFIDDLWQYIHPNTGFRWHQPGDPYDGKIGIGVYTAHKLNAGLRNYLKTKGLDIRPYYRNNGFIRLSKTRAYKEDLEFIRHHLNNGTPVHLLSWFDSKECYPFHWVTVTGIGDGNKPQVTIATWGQKIIIKDFQAFWTRRGLKDYKVMYAFEISS